MGDMADYYREPPPVVRHYREHPLNPNKPRRMREFLGQEKYWVNAQLEMLRIKDMDADYLLATMMHLLKRAPEVFLVLDLEAELEMGEPKITNPFTEMQLTPLFLRMRQRYLKLTSE